MFELGIVLRWNPAISGVLPRPPPPSSQIPAGTGVLYRHSSSNHHHFHPKVPCFNPFNPSPLRITAALPVLSLSSEEAAAPGAGDIPQLQHSPGKIHQSSSSSVHHPEVDFYSSSKASKCQTLHQPGAGAYPGHKHQPSSSPEPPGTSKHIPASCERSHSHTASTGLGNKNQYSFRNLRDRQCWKHCHGIYG